jgi:hypothetical protein
MKINITKLFRKENLIWGMIRLDEFTTPSSSTWNWETNTIITFNGEIGQPLTYTINKMSSLLGTENRIQPTDPEYVEVFNENQPKDGWLLKLTSTDLAKIHPTLEKDLEKLVFWAKMKN